jgi:hypothetical protein
MGKNKGTGGIEPGGGNRDRNRFGLADFSETSHFKRFNRGGTFQLVEDHAADGLRRNGQTAGLHPAQQGEAEGTSRASLRGSRERC